MRLGHECQAPTTPRLAFQPRRATGVEARVAFGRRWSLRFASPQPRPKGTPAASVSNELSPRFASFVGSCAGLLATEWRLGQRSSAEKNDQSMPICSSQSRSPRRRI